MESLQVQIPQIQISPPTVYDSLLDRAHKKAEGTPITDHRFPRVVFESVRRKKVGSDPKGFIKNTKLMLATWTTAQMQEAASAMVHDPHFKELKVLNGNRVPNGKAHQAELLQAMSQLIKSKKLTEASAPRSVPRSVPCSVPRSVPRSVPSTSPIAKVGEVIKEIPKIPDGSEGSERPDERPAILDIPERADTNTPDGPESLEPLLGSSDLDSSDSSDSFDSADSADSDSKKRKEVPVDCSDCVNSFDNCNGFNGFNGFNAFNAFNADSKKCKFNGRTIFNHIICGKCFKPLDDGEIPRNYTCSCKL